MIILLTGSNCLTGLDLFANCLGQIDMMQSVDKLTKFHGQTAKTDQTAHLCSLVILCSLCCSLIVETAKAPDQVLIETLKDIIPFHAVGL